MSIVRQSVIDGYSTDNSKWLQHTSYNTTLADTVNIVCLLLRRTERISVVQWWNSPACPSHTPQPILLEKQIKWYCTPCQLFRKINFFTNWTQLLTYRLAWDLRSTLLGLKNVFICFLAIFAHFPSFARTISSLISGTCKAKLAVNQTFQIQLSLTMSDTNKSN